MREFIGGTFIIIALLMIPIALIGLISPKKFARKEASLPSRIKIFAVSVVAFFVFALIGGAILPDKEKNISIADSKAPLKHQESIDKPIKSTHADTLSSAPEIQAINETPDKSVHPEESESTKQPVPVPVVTDNDQTKLMDQEAVKSIFDKINAIENTFDKQMSDFRYVMDKVVNKKKLTKSEKRPVGESFLEMESTLQESDKMEVPKIKNPDAKRYITEVVDLQKKWSMLQQARLVDLFIKMDFDKAQDFAKKAESIQDDKAMSMMMAFNAVGLKLK